MTPNDEAVDGSIPTALLARAAALSPDLIDDGAAVVLWATITIPPGPVVSATLWSTAQGAYEARIDGHPVSEALLSPGWTAYERRLAVQETDVTALVSAGCKLEVQLGNGWWRGRLGWEGASGSYGERVCFLAALHVEMADGSVHVVTTDESWQAHLSDTVENSLYNGQTIDARLRGHRRPVPLREVEIDRSTLVEQVAPPIVRQELVRPERIWKAPSGRTIIDFGQNLVGWVQLTVRGDVGDRIEVRHAEELQEGELYRVALRTARATDVFVLSGGHDEFEPTLTFHGFRYVDIAGHPGELSEDDIRAVVVHSDIRRTGWFACSDDRVNRLVENSVWSQRGNFFGVPTDCPQRDERLGWTGDIAVYAPTAAFQFDVQDFLRSWMLDLEAETVGLGDGIVPDVVPDFLRVASSRPGTRTPRAVWGDAAVWVPEALWWAYGDRDLLRAQYAIMVTHLESIEQVLSADGVWNHGFQFGDWLDPDAPAEDAARAKADPSVVATACLVRSADFLALAARELGLADDEARWSALATRTRSAFLSAYVDQDGSILSDCATVYALAIHFRVLDGDLARAAGRRLAEIVRAAEYRVSTGFAGTPYVTWALGETGHVEEAYRLLLVETCPSWLYPIAMGATTIWERWDSLLPDGRANPGGMTSFNHYALGAVADWLYSIVAGIRPARAGYSRILLQPTPGPGLEWARATLQSVQGKITSGWRRDGDLIHIEVEVPPGRVADLLLPDGSQDVVGPGVHARIVSETPSPPEPV